MWPGLAAQMPPARGLQWDLNFQITKPPNQHVFCGTYWVPGLAKKNWTRSLHQPREIGGTQVVLSPAPIMSKVA